MTIKLNKPFAANTAANEDDVRSIKRALNWIGYYTPCKKTGLSTVADGAVFDALRQFQADHDLPATGRAKPNDETIKALNEDVSKIWKEEN